MGTLYLTVVIKHIERWNGNETASDYASVGGAPEAYDSRRVCVCVCVCVYVFHAHFFATAKN